MLPCHLLRIGHFDNAFYLQHFLLLPKWHHSNYLTLGPPKTRWEKGSVIYDPYFTDQKSEAPKEKMTQCRSHPGLGETLGVLVSDSRPVSVH